VGEGKSVAPSFLLACVLWEDVYHGWTQRVEEGGQPMPALQEAIDEVFDRRIGDVSGRGKLAADMREIWVMQPRFEKRVGSSPLGMVIQPRFRAGFDFLRLRADVGEISEELAQWWQLFQFAPDDEREDMLEQVREQARQEQKTRQRAAPAARKAPAARPAKDASDAGAEHPADGPVPDQPNPVDGAAPKKRRRRKRKPSGDAGAPGAADAPL
jgi:poly(A) polymerase